VLRDLCCGLVFVRPCYRCPEVAGHCFRFCSLILVKLGRMRLFSSLSVLKLPMLRLTGYASRKIIIIIYVRKCHFNGVQFISLYCYCLLILIICRRDILNSVAMSFLVILADNMAAMALFLVSFMLIMYSNRSSWSSIISDSDTL
jgi:hypothetical protein